MLRATAARIRLEPGRSYLASFDLSGTLVNTGRLPLKVERLTDCWEIARKHVGPTATGLVGESLRGPANHVTHLIRCRDARAVFGLHDYAFAYGLLYGLQLLDSYCGELVVVTPYGWTARPQWGGAAPTLAELQALKPPRKTGGGSALRAV